jgi:hypothetical protein
LTGGGVASILGSQRAGDGDDATGATLCPPGRCPALFSTLRAGAAGAPAPPPAGGHPLLVSTFGIALGVPLLLTGGVYALPGIGLALVGAVGMSLSVRLKGAQ